MGGEQAGLRAADERRYRIVPSHRVGDGRGVQLSAIEVTRLIREALRDPGNALALARRVEGPGPRDSRSVEAVVRGCADGQLVVPLTKARYTRVPRRSSADDADIDLDGPLPALNGDDDLNDERGELQEP